MEKEYTGTQWLSLLLINTALGRVETTQEDSFLLSCYVFIDKHSKIRIKINISCNNIANSTPKAGLITLAMYYPNLVTTQHKQASEQWHYNDSVHFSSKHEYTAQHTSIQTMSHENLWYNDDILPVLVIKKSNSNYIIYFIMHQANCADQLFTTASTPFHKTVG